MGSPSSPLRMGTAPNLLSLSGSARRLAPPCGAMGAARPTVRMVEMRSPRRILWWAVSLRDLVSNSPEKRQRAKSCHCSSCQCPIGNWQHLHIGNILKTPRQPMRQTVGRDRRARRNEAPTQHHRRIIADGSGSCPYHANLPRWYFHFTPDLSLMRLIAASAAGARRPSCFIKCDSRGMSEESPISPIEPMQTPRCWIQ